MQLKLQRLIRPTAAYIFLYIILGIVIWAATYIGVFYTRDISLTELLSQPLNTDFLWENILSFVFTLLNSILLLQFINRFTFVSARTFLPIFVFALLIAVWEPAHAMYKSNAALLLFVLALFQFFSTPEHGTEKAFLGSFLIACASLLMNEFIFIITACWLGFIIIRCFSIRVIFASILGLFVPWLLYAVVVYAISDTFDIYELFSIGFSLGFSMENLQLPTKIYIGLLFVMFLISLFGTYANFHNLTSSTRRNINFILILLIYFIIIFILQENFEGTYFPFIALCFSIFISNVFSMKTNLFLSILFLVFFCVNIVFVIYNFLW